MTPDVQSRPLGDLVDPKRGISYGIVKVGEFVTGGVRVIRGGDIRGGRITIDDDRRVTEEVSRQFRRTVLKGGEIVMNLIAEPGHTAIVPPELAGANVTRDVAVIPLLDRVDHRYVNYCLRSPVSVGWFVSRLQGSVTQKINLGTLADLPVRLPAIAEQRAIVRVLGSLDDKIELNRRMNETLEAMAQAIFKSWFVNFEPVRAKAEGRQPVGMDAATAALFPDSFEGPELGEIPRGWGVGTLGAVAGVNMRSITAAYPHEAIKYIDISSVTTGTLAGTTPYRISEAPSRAKRLVRHGDTIWSCVRPNRKSYLFISRPDPNLVVSTGFAVLTPNAVPPTYLYAWVTTDEFVDYLAARADGSAYPAVRPDDFASAEVLIPPEPILARFEECVGPMRERIAHNERESRTLAAIRDALLPKLMSGAVRVGEAARVAGGEA